MSSPRLLLAAAALLAFSIADAALAAGPANCPHPVAPRAVRATVHARFANYPRPLTLPTDRANREVFRTAVNFRAFDDGYSETGISDTAGYADFKRSFTHPCRADDGYADTGISDCTISPRQLWGRRAPKIDDGYADTGIYDVE